MRVLSTLVLLFSLSNFSNAGEVLPKSCLGKYGGEMPAYSIVVGGSELMIDEHDVYIAITKDAVIYTGGDLELTGLYSAFKQSKNEYVIKAELTNGRTVNYELSFIWNKKDEKLYLTPKNGQSEAILERLDQ